MPFELFCYAENTEPRIFNRKVRGNYTPDEADKEKFQSTSFIKCLDLISEGPIEGIVDATGALTQGADILKGVYLNEVPVQLTSDSATPLYNFRNISLAYKKGSESQTPFYTNQNDNFYWLKDFSYTSKTVGLNINLNNQTVLEAASQNAKKIIAQGSYSVVDSDVDFLGVTLSIEQCHNTDEDGVQQINEGGFHIYGDITGVAHRSLPEGEVVPIQMEGNNEYNVHAFFKGLALSPYKEDIFFKLRSTKDIGSTRPRHIHIRNTTEQSINFRSKFSASLDSVTEIVNSNLSNPHSATVATLVSAENFRGPPTRSFDMKLKKVKVPSNYIEKKIGPDGPTKKRDYNSSLGAEWSEHTSEERHEGIWDGNFKSELEWTDNPAWILYDLITNDRYGLGEYITNTYIDKWELYKIAKYCDELVPTSMGNTDNDGFIQERRFSCNILLQNASDAFQTLNEIASIFRGIAYFNNLDIFVTINSLKDSIMAFTNNDVIDGIFRYSGTPEHTKFTAIKVAYKDKEDSFLPKYAYIEDPEGIIRYGIRLREITAVGCTSRDQALRLGRWTLLTASLEEETISFSTDRKAEYISPGQVFTIHDELRKDYRVAGRVKGVINHHDPVKNNFILLDQQLDTGNYDFTSISFLIPGEDFQGESDTKQFKEFVHRNGYQIGAQDNGDRIAPHFIPPIPLHSDPLAQGGDSRNTSLHNYIENTPSGAKIKTDEDEDLVLKTLISGSYINNSAKYKTLNDYFLESGILKTLRNGNDRSEVTDKIRDGAIYILHGNKKGGENKDFIGKDYQLLSMGENQDGTYSMVGLEYDSGKFNKADKLSTIYTETDYDYEPGPKKPGGPGDDLPPGQPEVPPGVPQIINYGYPKTNTVDLIVRASGDINSQGEEISKVLYYFHNTQENENYYKNNLSSAFYGMRVSEITESYYGKLLTAKDNSLDVLQNGQYILSGFQNCGDYKVVYDNTKTADANHETPSGKAAVGGNENLSVSLSTFQTANFNPFLDVQRPRNPQEYGEIYTSGCTVFSQDYEGSKTGYVLSGEFELPDPNAYYELRWYEANSFGKSPEKIMFFKGARDLKPPAKPSNFLVSINELFPNLLNFSWVNQAAQDNDLIGFRIYTGHEGSNIDAINFNNYSNSSNPFNEYPTPKDNSSFAEIIGKNASYFTYEADTSNGTLRDNKGNAIGFQDTGAFHIRSFDYSENLSDGENSNILTLTNISTAPSLYLSGEIREEGKGTASHGFYPILHAFYSGVYHEFNSFNNYTLKITDETFGFGAPKIYKINKEDIVVSPLEYGAGASGYLEIREALPDSCYFGEIYAKITDGRETQEGNHRGCIPKDLFPPVKLNNFRVSKQFSNFRFSWDPPSEGDVEKILLYTGSGHSNWNINLSDEGTTTNLTDNTYQAQVEYFSISDPFDFPLFPIDKFREPGQASYEKTIFPFHAVPVDTSNNTGMYANATYKYVNLVGPEVHTSGEATTDGRSLIHVFYSGIGQNDESFKFYETEYQDVSAAGLSLINSYQDHKKAGHDESKLGKGSGHFTFEANGTHFYEVRSRVIFDSFESNFSEDLRLSNYEYDIVSDYIYAPPDRVPPGKPEWITSSKNGSNIFLSWNNPQDKDLASIVLYSGHKNYTGEDRGTYIHQKTLTTSDIIPLTNFRKNSDGDLFFWLRAVDSSNNTGEFSIGNTKQGGGSQFPHNDLNGAPYNSGQKVSIGVPEPLFSQHIIATTGIELDEKGDGSARPFISYKITGVLDYQKAYYKVDLAKTSNYNPLRDSQPADIEHGVQTNTMTGSGTFFNLTADTDYYIRARYHEFDGRVSEYTNCFQNPIKTPKDSSPPLNPGNFTIVSGPKQNIIRWDWGEGVSKDLASILVYKTGIPTGRVLEDSSLLGKYCWESQHISGYFEKYQDEYEYQLAPSTSFIDLNVVTGMYSGFGAESNSYKYQEPLNTVYYHYFLKTVDRSGNTGVAFVSGVSEDPHNSYPVNLSKTESDTFVNTQYGTVPHNQGYVTGGAISANYISNVYAGNIISSSITSTDFILAHPSGRILSDSIHTLGPAYGPNPAPGSHDYDYLAGKGIYADHKMFRIGDPEGFGMFWTGEKLGDGSYKQPSFNRDADGWHSIDINPNTLEIKGNLTAGTVRIGASDESALDVDSVGNLTIGDQRKNITGFFEGTLGYSGILRDEFGQSEPESVLPPVTTDGGRAFVQLNLDDFSNAELSDLNGGGMFIELHWTRGGDRGIEHRQIKSIDLRQDRSYAQGFGKTEIRIPFSANQGVNLSNKFGNTYYLKGLTTTGDKSIYDDATTYPSEYKQPIYRDWYRVHNAKFKVLNDGRLFAADAQIAGTVRASSFQAGDTIILGDEYNTENTVISSYGFVDDFACKQTPTKDAQGWQIRGDGSATFKSVEIRSGIISGVELAAGDCDSKNHFRVNSEGDISVGNSRTYNRNNFYVTREGELHATDAFFSGDVTITGVLDVGMGLQIATDVQGYKDGNDGTFHSEGAKGILLTKEDIRTTNFDDAAIDLPSLVGHGRPQNRGWKISNDGRAIFFGAYITGGFLSGNSIIAGEGTTDKPWFKVTADGEMQVGQTTGHFDKPGSKRRTPATAPDSGEGLYISRKGKLYAQDAYIRGNITGDAGKIGSLYLNRDYLASYDYTSIGRNSRTSKEWQAGRTGLYIGKYGQISIANTGGLIFAYDPDINQDYVTITGIASSSNRGGPLTNQTIQNQWAGDGKGRGFVFAGHGDSWLANFKTDPYSSSGIARQVETQINGDIQNPEKDRNYTIMAKSPIGYDVLGIYMETDLGTCTVKWQKNSPEAATDNLLGLNDITAGSNYVNMSVSAEGSYHDFINKTYKHGVNNTIKHNTPPGQNLLNSANVINPDADDCYIVCVPTTVGTTTSLRFRIDLKRNGSEDTKN